jgi:ATP-binding cassette subfamily B protein
VFGNQTRDIGRYQQENQRLVGLEVRQQMIGQGFCAVVQSFLSITPALIYLTAGLLIAHRHAVSAGTVVAFTTLQTRLYFPIGQLLQVSVELRSSLALFDRVFEYLDVAPDIADAPGAVDLPATGAGGQVALRDVCFRYPGASPGALSGVSLAAGPGCPPSSTRTSSTSSTGAGSRNPARTATCCARAACTRRRTRSSSKAGKSSGGAPTATS